MTSRYRGENAVPLSLKGVGIAPTVEPSVVIGMGIPLLSFPRFHSFRQTNCTSRFAIWFPPCVQPCGVRYIAVASDHSCIRVISLDWQILVTH